MVLPRLFDDLPSGFSWAYPSGVPDTRRARGHPPLYPTQHHQGRGRIVRNAVHSYEPHRILVDPPVVLRIPVPQGQRPRIAVGTLSWPDSSVVAPVYGP